MLGGEADDVVDCKSTTSVTSSGAEHVHPISKPVIEESPVLDHIREMILQAQRHGCWQVGIGGLEHPPTDRYVSSILCGLPVTAVFNCAIELWRSLEIDDDELLEIAIRDVSFQIQLQKEREEASGDVKECKEDSQPTRFEDSPREPKLQRMYSHSSDSFRQRFNPRVDPTVLYLEINKLTFHLDNFLFRIEKHESRRTIFDPVFEGSGSLMVRNVSIKIRVECVKEYRRKNGSRVPVPLLQLRELDIQLEKVKLKVKNTGADWLLNKVVKGFEDNITQIMATNLIDQLKEQLNLALENLNGYSEVNPDLLLGFFGIAMDDLDEKVVFV